MMLRLLPSRTKKLPTMEVGMQAAQIASGRSIMVRTTSPPRPRKKIAASTMVATVVTA